MKRLVNGMKRELSIFLEAGGSVEDYVTLCDERLATERGIVDNMEREFKILESKMAKDGQDKIAESWARKNATLRSLGLPTVLMPDVED